MKNNEEYAVSVRKPDGTIETKKEKHKGILGNKVVTKIPFIRGVFNFVDSLVLDGLSTFLEENPAIAKGILERCLGAARAREAARKARDLTRRKTVLESASLPGK